MNVFIFILLFVTFLTPWILSSHLSVCFSLFLCIFFHKNYDIKLLSLDPIYIISLNLSIHISDQNFQNLVDTVISYRGKLETHFLLFRYGYFMLFYEFQTNLWAKWLNQNVKLFLWLWLHHISACPQSTRHHDNNDIIRVSVYEWCGQIVPKLSHSPFSNKQQTLKTQ